MHNVPLYMINGALGAGKTTLLQYLLQQERFSQARVIENEFASESVDTALVAARAKEVATIAGACICCSTGDELLTALRDFAQTGDEPVIIESTGVADTLRVIEKLVVNDIFELYDLAQVLYVVDALETENGKLSEAMRREAEAADIVLVSKLDKLPAMERRALHASLTDQGLSRIIGMDHGVFPLAELGEASHMLDYFTEYDGEIAVSDTPTYSVIDTAALSLTPAELEAVWPHFVEAYGVRRLKGCITHDGQQWHVEATPRQFVVDRGGGALKLVLIGERASAISRTVFCQELGR